MTDFITQFFTSGQLVTQSDMNNFYQGKDQNSTAYFNAYFGNQPTITNGLEITQIGLINEFNFTAGTVRFIDQINTISGSLAQATFANVPAYNDLYITIPSVGSSPQYYIVIKLIQTVVNDNTLVNTAEILDTAMTLAQIAAMPNPNQYIVYCAITNTSGINVTISIDNNCVLFNPLQGLTATNSLDGQPNLTLQNNLTVQGTTTLSTTTVPTVTPSTDSSTKAANTAFVQNVVNDYLPITGGTITGGLTVNGPVFLQGASNAITQITSDNSSKIATTAFAQNAINLYQLNNFYIRVTTDFSVINTVASSTVINIMAFRNPVGSNWIANVGGAFNTGPTVSGQLKIDLTDLFGMRPEDVSGTVSVGVMGSQTVQCGLGTSDSGNTLYLGQSSLIVPVTLPVNSAVFFSGTFSFGGF